MENNQQTPGLEKAAPKAKWFTLRQKVFLALSVNAFAVLSVLFFAPIEIYLGNVLEFGFAFTHVWWLLLVASLLIVAVIGAVECLLPDKLFLAANTGVFALGLACYVQAMFLNGQMGTLTGETDVYGTGLLVGNLLIWVLLIAAVAAAAVILVKKGRRGLFTSAVTFVSLALIAMQTVAFVSMLLNTDTDSFDKGNYLSTEGQFELASDNNVVVFILDTCDNYFVQDALEAYPEMMDKLYGFTYYPNAISTHSRTYPSIPYMLTGELCYFDVPYTDYINNAYTDSVFLPRIHDAGVDVRLFTESPYVGAPVADKVANSASAMSGDLSTISVPDLFKQMLKISLYRELPYVAKPRFRYSVGSVNKQVVRLPDRFISEDDALFYQDLREKGLNISKDYDSAFRFYHLNGAHNGADIDRYGMRTEETTQAEAVIGDFHIIEDYIRRMQELGIYEDSTIIITADHGGGVKNLREDLEIPLPICPVFLVKEAGKGTEEPFRVSDAPVSHEDLFPTILAAYGLEYGEFADDGQPVYDIAEDAQRERYFYFTAFLSDADGEIALREYLVDGDARLQENWKLTGRNWDINYSQRAVSKKRLSDFLN